MAATNRCTFRRLWPRAPVTRFLWSFRSFTASLLPAGGGQGRDMNGILCLFPMDQKHMRNNIYFMFTGFIHFISFVWRIIIS